MQPPSRRVVFAHRSRIRSPRGAVGRVSPAGRGLDHKATLRTTVPALSGVRCCARRAASEACGEVCDRPTRPPDWSTTCQPTSLPGTPGQYGTPPSPNMHAELAPGHAMRRLRRRSVSPFGFDQHAGDPARATRSRPQSMQSHCAASTTRGSAPAETRIQDFAWRSPRLGPAPLRALHVSEAGPRETRSSPWLSGKVGLRPMWPRYSRACEWPRVVVSCRPLGVRCCRCCSWGDRGVHGDQRG